ncbi:MAG: DUF4926 domain-containing protein [Nitrospiraceae bacterium]
MTTGINLLDVVALMEDMPDRGLRRGQVGTIVGVPSPDVFEVESADHEGHPYASLALRARQSMVLHYHTA